MIGEIGLVNPTPNDVARHLEHIAPHLLPDGYEPEQPRFFSRLFGN